MNGDFVDELVDEQKNPNALLIEILSSAYDGWKRVVAVEGPDDPSFYREFLSAQSDIDETYILICKGKEPLLEFKEIAANYEWPVSLHFYYLCDRDFDDFIDKIEVGVWYTCGYSIESYFSNREYVGYVVGRFAKCNIPKIVKDSFLESFSEIYGESVRQCRGISALFCEARAQGQHPTFDDFGVDKIFDIKANELFRRKKVISDAIISLAIEGVTMAGILKRSRTFTDGDSARWLRGKLALQICRKSYDQAVSKAPANIGGVSQRVIILAARHSRLQRHFWDNCHSLTPIPARVETRFCCN